MSSGDIWPALSELGASESRLETKKGEIAALLRAAGDKRKELEAEEVKNRDLVAGIQRSKKSYARALEELAESGQQLQALMKRIVDEKYPLPYPFIPLNEKKGALAWPVSGRVITSFGPQKASPVQHDHHEQRDRDRPEEAGSARPGRPFGTGRLRGQLRGLRQPDHHRSWSDLLHPLRPLFRIPCRQGGCRPGRAGSSPCPGIRAPSRESASTSRSGTRRRPSIP